MKNRLRRLTVFLLAMTLWAHPVLQVLATEQGSLGEAQQEKEALENDLKEAQELIDSLKGSKEDIQSEVEELDKRLNEISGKVEDLENQLTRKRQEIADTETALNEAREEEAKQYENMKKRIQFMYENSHTSYIEMLLSSENFSQFLNAVEYITQISQYDRKMLEEYQNMQTIIADTQKALEEDYTSLQALEAKVQEEKQAVAALEAAKKGELDTVSDDLVDAQTVAKAYEAEIQAQNEVIAQIQAAQRAAAEAQAAQQAAQESQGAEEQSAGEDRTQQGDGQSVGSMTWPCPSSRRITSDYGPRVSPTAGASSNHKGIDIGAAYGADIVAADGGTVLVAAYSSSGGNYVIIDHGGGLCTVYMHASSLLVSAGQTVSRGQVIAKVGSTGISTGNHLHFGVTLNGNYVSPWGYVG